MNDEITKLFVVLPRLSPHTLLGLNHIVFLPLPIFPPSRETLACCDSSVPLSSPTEASGWCSGSHGDGYFFPLIKWNLLVPFSPTWLKGYTIMNQGQCKWERRRQRVAGQLLGWNGAGVYVWHCSWIIIKRNIKRSPLPPNELNMMQGEQKCGIKLDIAGYFYNVWGAKSSTIWLKGKWFHWQGI